MTDNKRVRSQMGKDAIWLTISKMMVSLIGIVTSMLLARFRTLEEYGTYSQITMVIDLTSTIALLGLPNSINYFLSKTEDKEKRKEFMSLYLTSVTAISIIIGICLNLTIPLLIKYFNNPKITIFSYMFIFIPWSSLLINSISNACIVYGKSNRLLIYNVAMAVITLFILIVSKVLSFSFERYVAINTISQIIYGMFALVWINKLVGGVKIRFQLQEFLEVLKFSIPMGLASVIGTLNAELDKLIIGRFFSTEEYAVYANAARQLPVTMVSASLTAVLLPKMVFLLQERRSKEAVELWNHTSQISFCFMFLISGGLVAFAPDIMSLFYSSKYVTENGVIVFRLYSIILLFSSIYWGLVLNATGKTKFIFYCSVISMICNCIGNFICYKIFGFAGPAISTLLITAVMAALQIYTTSKITEQSITDILPIRYIGKLLIEVTVLVLVGIYVRYEVFAYVEGMNGILLSIFFGIIMIAIYVLFNGKSLLKNWNYINQK